MNQIFKICFSLLMLGCISCNGANSGNASGSLCENPADEATAEQAEAPEVTPAEAAFIVISKQSMTIAVYDFRSKLLAAYPMACGKALGNKEKSGDMKTPEGVFSIQQIQDASGWSHDFGDGKGEMKGAYGSHFIRLKTPGHSGIGIHGTHDPSSIGTRASEGCIRLHNKDLLGLVSCAYVGMPVIITTSEADSAVPCAMPAEAKKGPTLTSSKTAETPAKKTVKAKKTDRVQSVKPTASKAQPAKARGKTKTHTIKRGETLSSIAKNYGVTMGHLEQLNSNMNPNKIRVGQKIIIDVK